MASKGGYSGGVKVLVSPEIDFDMAKFATQVRKLRRTIEDVLKKVEDKDVKIDVDADVKRAEKKLEDLVEEREATVNVDIDKGVATAKLAALCRPRTVDIKPVVNSAAARTALNTLAALAGGNVMKRGAQSLKYFAENMDLVALRASKTALKLSALTAVGGTLAGAMASAGKGIAGAASGLAVLPGIAASAAVGFAAMKTAISDAAERMEGLGYSLKNVKKVIGDRAWAKFGDTLQEVASRTLPALEDGMGKVGEACGDAIKSFLEIAGSAENLSRVSSIMDNTAAGMRQLGPAAGKVTTAFLELGVAGSKYFPAIAKYLEQCGQAFANWATEFVKTGQFDKSLQALGETAKGLFAAIGDVAGIIGAVGKAASEAGITLAPLGTALDKVHTAMDSIAGQQILLTFFRGCATAVEAFSNKLNPLTPLFEGLSDTWNQVAVPAGRAFAEIVNTISSVLQTILESGAVVDFFNSMSTAFAGLSEAGSPIGEMLSTMITLLGTLMETLMPIITALAETLNPIIQALAPLLTMIAQVLSASIVTALETLQPLLDIVVGLIEKVTQYLENHPETLEAVQKVLTAIAVLLGGAFLIALGAVVAIFLGLCKIIEWAVDLFEGIKKKAKEVGDKFAELKVKLQEFVDRIKTKWDELKNKASELKDRITEAVDRVKAKWQEIKDKISEFVNKIKSKWDELKNKASELKNGVSNSVETIKNKFREMGDRIGEVKDKIVNWFRELPTKIKNPLQGINLGTIGKNIITGLWNGMISVWNRAKGWIEGIGTWIKEHKGPKSYDQRLLIPAGQWIMGGFLEGLEDGWKDVRKGIISMTDEIPSLVSRGIGGTYGLSVDPTVNDAGMSGFGGSVVINEYYPTARPDSAIRDEVARGIRLAATV